MTDRLRFRLSPGARIQFSGRSWIVVGLEGQNVHLRAQGDSEGRFSCFLLYDIVNATDYRLLDIEFDVRAAAAHFSSLAELSDADRAVVIERTAHVLEMRTGYRS